LEVLNEATGDTGTFLSLKPLLKGGGEVLPGDCPDDPLSYDLERLLGQSPANRQHFNVVEEQKFTAARSGE
jgi:hypothetical protein